MLIKLPEFKPSSAVIVMETFSHKLMGIAAPMRQSMTYDQGPEMATHKELSKRTGVAVYFCSPRSPWQRTPMDWCASTCPRAPTFPSIARSRSTPLPIRSTTGPGMAWAYDHHLRSIGSFS
jgi:hypothetical protein